MKRRFFTLNSSRADLVSRLKFSIFNFKLESDSIPNNIPERSLIMSFVFFTAAHAVNKTFTCIEPIINKLSDSVEIQFGIRSS